MEWIVGLLISWLVTSFAFWITAKTLSGVQMRDAKSALIVAAIFGFLSFLFGKILFVVFGFATLGLGFLFAFLTWWAVNALLLKVTDVVSKRLTIRGFGWYFGAAAMISLVQTAVNWLVGKF